MLKYNIFFILLNITISKSIKQNTCNIIVPENPLSMRGLASPYIYENCDMNTNPSFVQASILDLDNGEISVYSPLIINKNTCPLVTPVFPKLPVRNIIGLWFGSNADNIKLIDTNGSLKKANCINGLGNSIFGQFAYCNAVEFFNATKNIIQIPQLNIANDGIICPTTRDFMIVDMDPSDNLQTSYIILNNKTAQNTAINRATYPEAKILVNPSDERLLSDVIYPILNCKPFTGRNLADSDSLVTSLALNELQATLQPLPQALIPINDPMVMINKKYSIEKLNLYRVGVNQKKVNTIDEANGGDFCEGLITTGASRLHKNKISFSSRPSPDLATANNLFTFLANRFNNTFVNLKCATFNKINPVVLFLERNIVIDADFKL